MNERATVCLIFWAAFVGIVIATVLPTFGFVSERPGYFITYRNDVEMLIDGVVILIGLAYLGLQL